MRIRIRDTGAVVYDDEFRRLHPETSFPLVIDADILDAFGADPVLEGAQPTLTATQYSSYDGVEQISGQWFTKYIAVDYTAEQIAAAQAAQRVGMNISDRQFFQQAAIAGVITQAEALAAVQTGTIPSVLAAIVDSIPDAAQKFAAQMLLAGATEFSRTHPLTDAIGAALTWTPEQIDQFFSAAAQL